MEHMEYIDIGNIIKQRRKELHITQEELCEGICEPVTISRIENGKQIPSTSTLRSILERLDLPSETLISLVPMPIFLNQTVFQEVLVEYESFFQFSNTVSNISLEELKMKIESIKCDTPSSKQLQFILLTTLKICDNSFNVKKSIKETLQCIRITLTDFSEKDFSKCILNYNEFALILLLAILHYHNNDLNISKKLIDKLIFHIDSHFSFQNNSDLILKFSMVFIFINIKSKQYSDAYTLGLYIKEQCIKHQKYKYLGNLYEHLYYCSENRKEKNDFLEKAYYMYVATENENGIHRINLIKKNQNV